VRRGAHGVEAARRHGEPRRRGLRRRSGARSDLRATTIGPKGREGRDVAYGAQDGSMWLLQSRRRRVWEKPLDGARGPGGWRTPPVPRSPRTGSGWRCEAVQRVRGTGSAPGEVKRRPRDLPAAALLAERPAAARVCGRRLWGGLENQGRGALFVGRLGEAWACAPDKGGRRNPRRGLGLCCARRGEGDGADRRAPLVSGEARGAAERGERAGLRGWLAGPAGRRTERRAGLERWARNAGASVGRA